jgi:hypothetical protein
MMQQAGIAKKSRLNNTSIMLYVIIRTGRGAGYACS